MTFIVFIGLNKASIRIHYQFKFNFELLSAATFNEVGDIPSSIWKRIKVLLASLILSGLRVKKASLPRSRF